MKNLEFEVACPGGLEAIKSSLATLPLASRRGLLKQIDTYFRSPQGRRLKLREVRQSDRRYAELIAYSRTDSVSSRESKYYRYPVDNPQALLEALSFSLGVQSKVVKERELWIYEHTRIHLDTVEILGAYAEIETVIEGITEKEAEAEHIAVRALLALDTYPPVSSSYGDLVQQS
ncbi:MAG TPA: class IV adenylate cyclase [Capsulimonadaceae bacterium]|nr:class IV adenylate cyclase [Capsulimonadaceae bacterium]